MSAIARFFNQMGKQVWGYDRTSSPLTEQLEKEGVIISYEDDDRLLPQEIKDNPENTLVVYTPAVPAASLLLTYFNQENYPIYKRSNVLGMITEETFNLSVAGTHGKTTTSCMLAAIFKQSDKRFTAFLGGISSDLQSNYYHQDGEGAHYSITEADEYDRSFLHLSPTIACVTSTDSDHLDIYGEASEVEASFQEFANKIADPEMLFMAKAKTSELKGTSYSAYEMDADLRAEIHSSSSRGTRFSIYRNGDIVLKNLYVNIPGTHNTENATVAALMALKAGVSELDIRRGLEHFKGIKRRFEYIIEEDDLVYIDDYAHHPSELNSIIDSVRNLYPNKKITAVFQPHLYSRTRDFVEGFAKALSQVDEVILLPIYPARELPIEGVGSEIIRDKMTLENTQIVEKKDLVKYLDLATCEVVLTLGAGDIDREVESLKAKYYG